MLFFIFMLYNVLVRLFMFSDLHVCKSSDASGRSKSLKMGAIQINSFIFKGSVILEIQQTLLRSCKSSRARRNKIYNQGFVFLVRTQLEQYIRMSASSFSAFFMSLCTLNFCSTNKPALTFISSTSEVFNYGAIELIESISSGHSTFFYCRNPKLGSKR